MTFAPRKFPRRGWLGLALIALFWTLNWTLPGLRTMCLFFPLWLGFCLTVDALVFFRTATSLIARSLKNYLLLFLYSAPSWWLFELINARTRNWEYLGRDQVPDLAYAVFATLSFSTVMPAVFGAAELVAGFPWARRLRIGPRIADRPAFRRLFFALGWAMLALLLWQPRYFFPFVWLSVYFILEPLNAWLKNPHLLRFTGRGDWRPVLSLWLGCLLCGFFWEMWNFYAFPKWIYHVPFVDFLRVFEMPLLGYLGYLPFSLELYALYHLLNRLFTGNRSDFLILTGADQPSPR